MLTVQGVLQVHVGWLEGGTAILAFRGTQTAQDGLQDVKIVRQSIDHLQKMFPGTQAHSGKLFNHMHGFGMPAACICRSVLPVWHVWSMHHSIYVPAIPSAHVSLNESPGLMTWRKPGKHKAFICLGLHVSACVWNVCAVDFASACLLAFVCAALPGSCSKSDSLQFGVRIV